MASKSEGGNRKIDLAGITTKDLLLESLTTEPLYLVSAECRKQVPTCFSSILANSPYVNGFMVE